MWNLRCFLCATNEGVFLDVTDDNKHTFSEQLETCFLIKEPIDSEQESKICYKCAYELSQCTLFVKKYRKSCDTSGLKGKGAENHCTLCAEPAEKGHIFDLKEDITSLNIFFEKTKQIFNIDFVREEDGSKLVCLTCRYILDLLYDLKNVFQHTTNRLKDVGREDIDYLCYPKTKTTVVNRKTTVSEFTPIEIYSSSDSDVKIRNMARKKSKNNILTISKFKSTKHKINKLKVNKQLKSSNSRVCGKCKDSVENGGDMYRFHKTGLTVCKTCWLITDPSKSASQKRKQAHSIETRLCTVFLKDVLTHETYKNEKVYRVEEDDQGNKTYIITDESSESESKSQKDSPIKKKPVTSDVETATKKTNLKRATRSSKVDASESEDHASKKRKANHDEEKKSEEVPVKNNLSKYRRTNLKQKIVKSKTSISDSDSSIRVGSRRNTRLAKTSISSASEPDVESKQNRKTLKTIPENVTKNAGNVPVSDDLTSNEEGRGGRKRPRKAVAEAAKAEAVSKEEADNGKEDNVKRSRSSSISDMQAGSKVKSTKRRPSLPTTVENADPINVIINSDSESPKEKVDYKCDECELTFDNKLSSMAHKLIHSKQLEIKLEKISLENIQKEKRTAEESEPADEQLDDQSEPLKMTLEDDEEEEEPMVNAGATSDGRNESATESSCNNVENRDHLSEKVTSKDQVDEKLSTEKDSTVNKEEDSQNKEKEPAVAESSSDTDLKRRLSKNNDSVISHSNTEESENHIRQPDVCEESTDIDKSKKDTDVKNSEKTSQVDEPMEKEDVENNSKEKKGEEDKNVDAELKALENAPSLTNSNGTIITVTDSKETLKSDDENEISIIQQNGGDDKEVESDTDIKIVDTGSSQNSNEGDRAPSPKIVDIFEEDSRNKMQDPKSTEKSSTSAELEVLNTPKDGLVPDSDEVQIVEEDSSISDVIEQKKQSTDSAGKISATEVLKEVFDLATAEVQKRQNATSAHNTNDNLEAETLENISREVQNSADMPSLDPIASADGDDSTPTVKQGDSTSGAKDDNSILVVEDDDSTPAAKDDNSTPAVEKDDSTPAAKDANSAAAVKDEASAAAVKDDDSAAAVKDDSTPAVKEVDSTPAVKEDDSTPGVKEDDSTPAVKDDSTTANKKDDSTPANREDDSTPANKKHDSTHANKEDASTTTNRKDKSISSPAKDKSISSPAKDKSISSPAKDKSISSPAKDKSISSPAKDKSTSSAAKDKSISSPAKDN